MRNLLFSLAFGLAGDLAWGAICPVENIPIQSISAQASGRVTNLSSFNKNRDYDRFITVVTKHVAARLAGQGLCPTSGESQQRSLLQFVDWPLTTLEAPAVVPVIPEWSSRGCRLRSPWLDLTVERTPVPWVRGIIRWNERQLLVDQAALAGAQNMPTGVVMPLNYKVFDSYAEVFERTELDNEPSTVPVESMISADMLWLFRHTARQNYPFNGAVINFAGKIKFITAEGYNQLVVALIDRCFDSDGAEIRYGSIHDLIGSISLDSYKVDSIKYY